MFRANVMEYPPCISSCVQDMSELTGLETGLLSRCTNENLDPHLGRHHLCPLLCAERRNMAGCVPCQLYSGVSYKDANWGIQGRGVFGSASLGLCTPGASVLACVYPSFNINQREGQP